MLTVSSGFGRPALEPFWTCLSRHSNVWIWPIRIALQQLPFSEPVSSPLTSIKDPRHLESAPTSQRDQTSICVLEQWPSSPHDCHNVVTSTRCEFGELTGGRLEAISTGQVGSRVIARQ